MREHLVGTDEANGWRPPDFLNRAGLWHMVFSMRQGIVWQVLRTGQGSEKTLNEAQSRAEESFTRPKPSGPAWSGSC